MKSLMELFVFASDLSLLSWERGLKSLSSADYKNGKLVAPLVGAWIEIVKYMLKAVVKESLLSWERGLKFSYSASD